MEPSENTNLSASDASQSRSHRGLALTAIGTVLSLALLVTGLGTAPAPASAEVGDTTSIYDDAIAQGFENWSWTSNDTQSESEVFAGASAISVTPAGWEGFYIARNDDVSLPLDGELRFAANGGANPSAELGVVMTSTSGNGDEVRITLPQNAWQEFSIPLADLGGFGAFNGVWFQEVSGGPLETIFLDSIEIVETDASPAAAGPTLLVDVGERSLSRTVTDPASGVASEYEIAFPHAISEDIYGMNFVTNAVREELDIPVNRWGGNSTERYNHEVGSTNLAQDWFFMNAPEEIGGDHVFEQDNEADGTDTILTLPALGWVAKDRGAHCSYPTADVPSQEDFAHNTVDPSFNCGNGMVGGNELPAADQTITSVAVDETFAADWVAELVATHGSAADGGVEIYAIGNEPGLWHDTHRDVRDEPIGRVELIDRNVTWANAVKDVDPSAQVIGPVLWSGSSYYTTSDELLAGLRPGDVPTFSAEYLAEMRLASDAAGTRLLDQFAVNFYDDRVYNGGTDELRLEATRQLWDPTYAPQDWWVARDFLNGDGSAVIPRLNTLIDQNYPGTELAITEYNFGGGDTIAGALAQADVLGIFGREGLDTATVWDPYADWLGITEEEWGDRPMIDAFRLYRNYDGEGSQFGDVSVFGESSDEGTVAVHAAVRSSDDTVTILLINKTRTQVDSELSVPGISGSAERYLYDATTNGDIAAEGSFDVDGDGTVISLPARSATLLILTPGDEPPTPPTEPPTPPTEPPSPDAQVEAFDGAELIDPPASTREGQVLDSNSNTFVWAESGPVVLDADLTVDRMTPGEFNGTGIVPGLIASGTEVCSWYIIGDREDDRGRLSGAVSFGDEDVLGLIFRSTALRASNTLGAEATSYTVGQMERGDQMTLSSPEGVDTLTVDMAFGPHTDAVRIITNCGSDE